MQVLHSVIVMPKKQRPINGREYAKISLYPGGAAVAVYPCSVFPELLLVTYGAGFEILCSSAFVGTVGVNVELQNVL